MNIGKVSKQSKLSTKTVRYYSDIGLISTIGRSSAGYRQYDNKALRCLIFIRRARNFGFSIDDCRNLLELYNNENRCSFNVKFLARKRLVEIEEKQRELQKLHSELSVLTSSCKGNSHPDCPILDYLS